MRENQLRTHSIMKSPSRSLFAGCFVLTAACASTQTSPPSQTERIIATSDEGTIRSNESVRLATANVAAKPSVVLPALRDSYEELGIKVEVYQPGAGIGQVGNHYFIKTYKLGKAPLSTYLDCGNTMTGAVADNYKITMSVLSTVSAVGDSTTVETRASARADPAAATGGSVSCRSIGTLESAIHQALMRKLGS